MSDVPDALRHDEVVVVGGQEPKWAVFRCPCARGHRVVLDLHRSHRPHWRLDTDRAGRPSIQPSVDVQGDTRCHFLVHDGFVVWVRDYG